MIPQSDKEMADELFNRANDLLKPICELRDEALRAGLQLNFNINFDVATGMNRATVNVVKVLR